MRPIVFKLWLIRIEISHQSCFYVNLNNGSEFKLVSNYKIVIIESWEYKYQSYPFCSLTINLDNKCQLESDTKCT